jgi:hypothetical protein
VKENLQRISRTAIGFGLIRSGIMDGRLDAANYGTFTVDGGSRPGFHGGPYGYDYPTALWLDAYNREFDNALERKMASLKHSEVRNLHAMEARNRALRYVSGAPRPNK